MPQTRVELDIILKKKPGFFIRWGLVIVVMIIILLKLTPDDGQLGRNLFDAC